MIDVEAKEARERLDETRFGPKLPKVRELRAIVEHSRPTPAELVKLLNLAAEVWVAEEVEGRPLRVPALVLFADGRWAELVDALLPDAPMAFRDKLVAAFHQAVPSVTALTRYTGGPEDHRFGPILPSVRRLRTLAASLGAHGAACHIIDLVLEGLDADEPVPMLRLFADGRWSDVVDAILIAGARDFKDQVVAELRDLVQRQKETWKAKHDKLYARAGKPDHAGGAVMSGFKVPSLAGSYGATVMGDRLHSMNAQTHARIEVEKMVKEARAARQLSRGADLLQLGVGDTDELIDKLATPEASAEVMKLMTAHKPVAVMAALAIELEEWAKEHDEDSATYKLYIGVAMAIRLELEEASKDPV